MLTKSCHKNLVQGVNDLKHQLTFPNVISILIDNKKKIYPQQQLIRDLFSAYMDGTRSNYKAYSENSTMYSKWCSGARPIPLEILLEYDDDNKFKVMENDFLTKIIPNLINVSHARTQMENLINDNKNVIGDKKAEEILSQKNNAPFFTQVVRYAIFSDHKHNEASSPDLSGILLSNRQHILEQRFNNIRTRQDARFNHLTALTQMIVMKLRLILKMRQEV